MTTAGTAQHAAPRVGRNLRPPVGWIVSALMAVSWGPAAANAGYMVRASEAGAALDSSLMKGGGTDDTVVLQRVLDRAEKETPVHLIIDGAALVSGLNVHGNTTVECIAGGGLFLKDGASRAIIRNAHRSGGAIHDEWIIIRGCFLNGNRSENPGARPEREPSSNNQESDGSFISGLQFVGVNHVAIENVTLWNIRAFGASFSNASHINIRNVTVDHGGGADVDFEYLQTDGLSFGGPIRYVTVDGARLRTGDDALSFGASGGEGGELDALVMDPLPYRSSGPVLDVTVNNVQLMDSQFGVRLLSRKARIDRIVFNNVTGTINGPRLAVISSWTAQSAGDIGSIEFNNINVDRSPDAKLTATFLKTIQPLKERFRSFYDEDNGGVATFFNVNANIETLSIRNFRTKVTDSRPIFRIGPSANIEQMTVEASLLDDALQAIPLELDDGGRIERLRFSLDWMGKQADVGKKAISWLGGTIGELRWTDTPPQFVEAKWIGAGSVEVTFSQEVTAKDYSAGVQVTVHGKPVGIVRAFRDSSQPDVVRYLIAEKPRSSNDKISWAYEAARGEIQNMNGERLLSVAAKDVSR